MEIMTVHESKKDSILTDIVTYGGLGVLIAVNHFVLQENASWIIDAMALVAILWTAHKLFGKKDEMKICYSWEEARDHCHKKYTAKNNN